jgi:excisionase family DNA binding protein
MTTNEPHGGRIALTLEDARRALSISESGIYNLMKSGDLPSVKFGKSRRILMRDLEAFLERNRVEAVA